MKVVDCFKERPVISFEIFPPRPNASEKAIERFYDNLDVLASLKPAYISVTYGAGGSDNKSGTLALCCYIKQHYGIEVVPHIPGINFTKSAVKAYLADLKAADIENILALRGDLPADGKSQGDFQYASDLVSEIKRDGDFNILGACYPDVHPEAKDSVEDIKNLKCKIHAGVSQLITQLFFENEHYYQFLERCELAGIDVPVQAGIMSVVNERQIRRMATMNGVGLPPKFLRMMNHYQDNPIAMRDAGTAYAIDQIVDLLSEGVDGIHLYTMDNPVVTQRICGAIETLI
ncbi:methylenetetrahydrofolate reductase [NAD(P)H] [Secundilactobacillus mixtipabuli]|uniref:Methylenetetrahydrofolate reductase n=1 Tax=Secundilactobacillus mixtipabuli TaxID=1435342 RepID=A0A1Z5IAN1_9LACO|nr:methylenetetrahydrofolate reductase [NAD(P)H] [Secundilactobacillus mixtipabuli]GAW98832.1 5,10-methylenetetrahydrofolate reductase [Secundilactobacillus mixtipabuli]